ncbi:hypothetical protein Tco_1554293 [Tanacetum coccineum]
MSPPIRRKYHDSVAFATGCKRIKNSKRCNRKIRIPIAMWPCRVEEKMTLKEVDGQTVEEIETKIIAKDGTITRIPREYDGKGGAIVLTRWIEKMENVIDNSGCAENKSELENEFWNHKMVGANHAAYTDRFHELAKLVPHLVTPEVHLYQEVHSRNCSPSLEMKKCSSTPTNYYSNALLRLGILIDEAVQLWFLTKGNEQEIVLAEAEITEGHGSFDVIVGMDWLSQHKAVIMVFPKTCGGQDCLPQRARSCKTRVSYDLVILHESGQCYLSRKKVWFALMCTIKRAGQVNDDESLSLLLED